MVPTYLVRVLLAERLLSEIAKQIATTVAGSIHDHVLTRGSATSPTAKKNSWSRNLKVIELADPLSESLLALKTDLNTQVVTTKRAAHNTRRKTDLLSPHRAKKASRRPIGRAGPIIHKALASECRNEEKTITSKQNPRLIIERNAT